MNCRNIHFRSNEQERPVPTQREIREFQKQRKSMLCTECKKLSWKTHAQIMAADRFVCDHCGEPLPFDKGAWEHKHRKPPPKSLNDKINERG